MPAPLDPDITYEAEGVQVRVQRTPIKYDSLESIAGELPDAIQEIVCAVLDTLASSSKK
jgi:hypothetical protein